jgi:preprotein translocase subunit YajC
MLVQLAPFAMILVVFYFLLVRPQQQKAKETKAMLDGLRVNDDVVTTGGIHGKIVRLAEKVLVIEIAPKVQVKIDRPAVSDVLRGGKGEKSSEEKSA